MTAHVAAAAVVSIDCSPSPFSYCSHTHPACVALQPIVACIAFVCIGNKKFVKCMNTEWTRDYIKFIFIILSLTQSLTICLAPSLSRPPSVSRSISLPPFVSVVKLFASKMLWIVSSCECKKKLSEYHKRTATDTFVSAGYIYIVCQQRAACVCGCGDRCCCHCCCCSCDLHRQIFVLYTWFFQTSKRKGYIELLQMCVGVIEPSIVTILSICWFFSEKAKLIL